MQRACQPAPREDTRSSPGGTNLLEGRLLADLINGGNGKVEASQPGDKGFRKADDGQILRAGPPKEPVDCL